MKFSKEFQIGILTALALFILYFSFNYLKGHNILFDNNLFYIIYPRTDGLNVSNSVTVNGLKIGQVEKIELLQEYHDQILVTIELDKNILIPTNTKALLTDGGLLGDKIIELQLSNQKQYHTSLDTLIGIESRNLVDIVKMRALPLLTHLDSTIIQANNGLKIFVDQKSKINSLTGKVLKLTSQIGRMVHNSNKNMEQILNELKPSPKI